jgi:hypothetical protein
MTAVAEQWAVAVREPNDRFNPSAGYIVVVLEQASETNARKVYADRKNVATSLSYESVELRCGDQIIERWQGLR